MLSRGEENRGEEVGRSGLKYLPVVNDQTGCALLPGGWLSVGSSPRRSMLVGTCVSPDSLDRLQEVHH